MKQIILASTSPRRKEILSRLGIKFKAVDTKYREVMHEHFKPNDLVKFLSLGKALAGVKKYPQAVVIAADTIVVLRGKKLGKPKNKAEAGRMLKEISGSKHLIVTGLTVIDATTRQVLSACAHNTVHFKKISPEEIAQYIATKEPMDKAGAYAVQGIGSKFIKKVEGDFTNAVGMPLKTLKGILKEMGIVGAK